MDQELQDIKDLMDKDTGDGRDREGAVELAHAYVDAHYDMFAAYEDHSIALCVILIDGWRTEGDEESVQLMEAWLLHKFPPQTIVGTVN